MAEKSHDHLEATMAEMDGPGVGESGGGSEAVEDQDVDRGPTRLRWLVTAAVLLIGLAILAVPIAWAIAHVLAIAMVQPAHPIVWMSFILLATLSLALVLLFAYWFLRRAA